MTKVFVAEATQTDPPRVRVRYTLAIGPFSFDVYMDKHPDAARRRVTWRLAEDRPSTFFAESSGYGSPATCFRMIPVASA